MLTQISFLVVLTFITGASSACAQNVLGQGGKSAAKGGAISPAEMPASAELASQAESLRSAKRYAQAERKLLEMLDLRRKALQPDAVAIAGDLNALGELCNRQGRTSEAELRFHCAMDAAKPHLKPNSPLCQKILLNQADTYFKAHKFEASEAADRKLLLIKEQLAGDNKQSLLPILSALGQICLLDQRYEQAESFFERSLTTMQLTGAPPGEYLNQVFRELSEVYLKQGRTAEASRLRMRMLKLKRAAAGASGSKRP